MVVVLWVIMVLSLLISGFAFTMHVETQVASFSRKELKAEMLARSGVEIAKMLLLLDERSPTDAGYDARNQAWATNTDFYVDHALGEGTLNVEVTDEESRLPLNGLSKEQLAKLMEVIGVDPLDGDVIVDSIIDWKDDNDLHQLNGAEDDYYASLSPPYRCKNGPFDRVEELLLVRGVTPEIFYGVTGEDDEPGLPGLRDLLTTHSTGQVNINTASAPVLQVLFGLDDVQVGAVLAWRDGQDGIAGTEDDQPFREVAEMLALVGRNKGEARNQSAAVATVKSQFFRVKSTGNLVRTRYTITAVLLRRQDGICVATAWQEGRGGE
jgi:general secretion pathway protein K